MEEFRKKMEKHKEQEYPEMKREITAFVLMNVEGRHEEKIMDKLEALEEVREAHSVHGSIDIIIRVKLIRDLLSSDAELISQFLTSTIRQWTGVISTQTLLPVSPGSRIETELFALQNPYSVNVVIALVPVNKPGDTVFKRGIRLVAQLPDKVVDVRNVAGTSPG